MSTAAGEALGFDPELLSDVNTAVSEACNNVIQHAYGDEPGPFSVDLALTSEGVQARIRDHGRGIHRTAPEQDGLKVGLPKLTISAVADQAEFIPPPQRGHRGEARVQWWHGCGPDLDAPRARRAGRDVAGATCIRAVG